MKFVCRAMGVLALLIGAALPAQSQAIKIYPSGSAIAAGQFVSEDSGGRVNPIAANSTSGVIGVAQNGAPGVGLPVTVQLYGPIQANMDGSCAVDQIVVISSTLNGAGHCQNSFPSAQVLGLSEQNFAATSPLGSLVSILISPLTATAQAGTGGTGSSIFASFQFGSATAITGTGNYIQLTTNAGSSNVLALSQTGAGTALSPYVGLFTLNVQGTDTKLLSSGTISGAAGTLLCLDANSGATTTSCNSGVGLTSVGLVITPGWLTVAGSPLTSNGSFTVTATGGQTSHQVIGTCGTATQFGPCSLVAGDLPSSITSNTSGNAATATALATLPTPCSSGNAPTGILANGNSTGCSPIGGTPAFPVTVTGGVSGAIPYFSSTTIEGASALLAQYGVMIGGGAGQPPSTIAATTNTSYALFGTAGAPAFRAIANSDLPGTLTANTSGNAATATQLAGTPSTCGAGVAAIGITASGAATGCFTPGGLANPMTTLGDSIYGGAGGAAQRLAGPTSPAGVPQIYGETPSGGVAGAPAWRTAGVTTRVIGGSTASDTILATDCTNREAYLGSAAVALTLPTATSLGVSQCILKIGNYTTGAGTAVTITPATWTIGPFAAASFQVPQNQWCVLTVDGTNWDTDCGTGGPQFGYFRITDYAGTHNQQWTSCEAAARAVDGICDTSGLQGTVVFPGTVGLIKGDAAADPVTVIWPGNGTVWQFPNLAGGTSCMLTDYMGTTGFGIGVSENDFTMQNTSAAGGALCGFQALLGSVSFGYWREDGIQFAQHGGGVATATSTTALTNCGPSGSTIFVCIQAGADGSGIHHFAVFDSSTTDANIVVVTGSTQGGAFCCSAELANGLIEANYVGGIPLSFWGTSAGEPNGITISNVTPQHPRAGLPNVYCQDTNGVSKVDVTFVGALYIELGADTTTAAFINDGCRRISIPGGASVKSEQASTTKTVFTSTNRTNTTWQIGTVNTSNGSGSWVQPVTIMNNAFTGEVLTSDSNGQFGGYTNGPSYFYNETISGSLHINSGTAGTYGQINSTDGGSGAEIFDISPITASGMSATIRHFRFTNTSGAAVCDTWDQGSNTSTTDTQICSAGAESYFGALSGNAFCFGSACSSHPGILNAGSGSEFYVLSNGQTFINGANLGLGSATCNASLYLVCAGSSQQLTIGYTGGISSSASAAFGTFAISTSAVMTNIIGTDTDLATAATVVPSSNVVCTDANSGFESGTTACGTPALFLPTMLYFGTISGTGTFATLPGLNRAINVDSATIYLGVPPSGTACSTYAVLELYDVTTTTAMATVTLTASTQQYSLSVVHAGAALGDQLALRTQTAPVGCGTNAAQATLMVQYH